MYCPGCGTEVREHQKFCMECGRALADAAQDTGEVPIVGANEPPSEQVRGEVTSAMGRMRDGTPLAPPPPAPEMRRSPEPAAAEPPPPVPPFDDGATAQDRWGRDVDPMLLGPSAPADPSTEERVYGGAARPGGAPPWPSDPDSTIRMPTQRPDADVTRRMPVRDRTVEMPLTRVQPPAPYPLEGDDGWPDDVRYVDDRGWDDDLEGPRVRVRFRILLIAGLLAAAAVVVAVLTRVVDITSAQPQAFPIGEWRINDLGTNNTVAGLIAAGAVFLGSVAWCFGLRFGAGFAGGGGLAVAGWSALMLGLAEVPLHTARNSPITGTVTLTREVGYWALVAAAGLGALVFLVSLGAAGADRRRGLDPWIAALGAASVLVAAAGPLIPVGGADITGNYDDATLGVDLPQLFFVGRLVQLALLAFAGIVGFLLVRRYGLGLAVGGLTAAGFQLVTAATKQTTFPIGPAYVNPGAVDFVPHAVTTVGMALAGFFALVALVMAVFDRRY